MKKGFTLIELLVVISLIGVLAVSVLSALNPIEQLNKGRDAGRRADASQLINAIDRYYAANEIFPWNNSSAFGTSALATTDDPFKDTAEKSGVGVCGDGDDTAEELLLAQQWDSSGCTGDGILVSGMELKSQFGSRKAFKSGQVAEDIFYVIKEPSDPSVSVCFKPSSKATRTDLTKLKFVNLETEPSIAACTTIVDWASADYTDYCLVCIPEE